MDQPDMVYYSTDHGLSNQMVFDRGKIQPGGKNHFKTRMNNKNHI